MSNRYTTTIHNDKYLEKHFFIWYRLCFNASGMPSAMLSDLLKLNAVVAVVAMVED